MKKLSILLAFLLVSWQAFAGQEIITDFSDNSVSVLNEELRKSNKAVSVLSDAIYGSVDGLSGSVNGIEARVTALETTTIIENRTDDPVDPESGRIWLRTDL